MESTTNYAIIALLKKKCEFQQRDIDTLKGIIKRYLPDYDIPEWINNYNQIDKLINTLEGK